MGTSPLSTFVGTALELQVRCIADLHGRRAYHGTQTCQQSAIVLSNHHAIDPLMKAQNGTLVRCCPVGI